MNQTASVSPGAAAETDWDAIVIGSGMGGSATAHALAMQGLRVLVIEKGPGELSKSRNISQQLEDPAERESIGRWPTKLSGSVDGREFDFFAPLGTGLGGSTVLYAAALDRFRPSDFSRRPHPDGGTIEWPLSYGDFAPYYAEAERLLEVSGTPDPLDREQTPKLSQPPPLNARDAFLFERFERAGLHPYRLHSGYRFVDSCDQCLGRVCLRDCKRNAANSLLAPAIATGRVAVLSHACVESIEADANHVRAVQVRVGGAAISLSAKAFVLAAGTYFSPVILLKSANEFWPEGLGNRHDQVGRNLMFHTSRFLAVWGKRSLPRNGPSKSIAFRDFYDAASGKFGEVQSTGIEASYDKLVHALRQQLTTGALSKIPFLQLLAPVPAFAGSRFLAGAAIFALIMEDLPYRENRVLPDADAPSGMRFHYAIREELHSRFEAYSKAASRSLKGIPRLWLTRRLTPNYGHPLGTCRIGLDATSSVADAQGAIHGLHNLYIGDGSFMPSSGGTNPSLTIAAHGLRVGTTIAKRVPPPD